jgi:hypothetical protein
VIDIVEILVHWYAGRSKNVADTRLWQVTWPQIAAHHEFIADQLKADVTQPTIHQRLVDERGLAASYASLRRYVAANIGEEVRRSQVTVLNPAGSALVLTSLLYKSINRPEFTERSAGDSRPRPIR